MHAFPPFSLEISASCLLPHGRLQPAESDTGEFESLALGPVVQAVCLACPHILHGVLIHQVRPVQAYYVETEQGCMEIEEKTSSNQIKQKIIDLSKTFFCRRQLSVLKRV